MAGSIEQLYQIVSDSLRRAEHATIRMNLDSRDEDSIAKSAMVKDLPRYRHFNLGEGAASWGAILFVDLRNSTKRANTVGAKTTYLTMHALLPALAYSVEQYGGYTVGFRGDGLFAIFGMNDQGFNPDGYEQGRVIADACSCGQFMIEAVDKVVNPALNQHDCAGNLHIGVGLDSGTVIVTRIGFNYADEVTAYGDAVNNASKICSVSNSNVIVSEEVNQLFPTGEGGKVQAKSVPGHPKLHEIVFPSPLLRAA